MALVNEGADRIARKHLYCSGGEWRPFGDKGELAKPTGNSSPPRKVQGSHPSTACLDAITARLRNGLKNTIYPLPSFLQADMCPSSQSHRLRLSCRSPYEWAAGPAYPHSLLSRLNQVSRHMQLSRSTTRWLGQGHGDPDLLHMYLGLPRGTLVVGVPHVTCIKLAAPAWDAALWGLLNSTTHPGMYLHLPVPSLEGHGGPQRWLQLWGAFFLEHKICK